MLVCEQDFHEEVLCINVARSVGPWIQPSFQTRFPNNNTWAQFQLHQQLSLCPLSLLTPLLFASSLLPSLVTIFVNWFLLDTPFVLLPLFASRFTS